MTAPRKTRYKRVQIYDGEWYRPVLRNHREECCACGLVHKVDYRITRRGNRFMLEFRATVDKKSTAAVRRAFKFDKE